ncbi:uncharacterized protein LOC126894246 isoform X2 [Daktulosphaira vitifoliae]|uniref:uncharacterized protein LOC126894246 isoform X2 n=1 Tax=Daktulosphaira vitifoliae TaxID=58002 RepID=UPI0021A97CC2|nr:uncharacterized protein LOC126894246 isoform X2 [Daktulosphaira vitifoliae]
MKPINLPVEKSLITLKENVQKAKEKLSKHKTDKVEEYKSRTSETQKNKKQKLDEPKAIDSTEKKEDNCIMINRSKIKLPFIGKMPFAKPVTKKTAGSQSKEVPNYMVETKCEELKEKPVTSVESRMHIMEHMISAINEKKIEKQTLPIDMDIDDENEYDEMILSAKTNFFQPQLNIDLPRNEVLHNFNLPHTSSLPQDLNAALNMIFPCNEPTIGTCVSVPVNIQNNNLMDPQNICIYPEMNRMLNSSPERKKKKNAPSQRKRRHMKKNMGKDDEYNKNEEEEVDDKLDELISSVSRKDNINKSNGNESEGDELAMLGIDVEDMAAQYY